MTTSEVISGGNIFPINQAYPDLVYSGFNLGTFTVNHPTYAVSQTYTDPILDLSHYEASYVSGGNGGTISITSPSVALDGQLIGLTVAGPLQLANLSGANSLGASSYPVPSTLALAFQAQVDSFAEGYPDDSPYQPHVIFSTDDSLPAAGPFDISGSGVLSAARQDEVILSPDLFTSSGFGSLQINDSDGNVSVPAGVSLDPGPLGSVTIQAANVDIEGSITAPGGDLAFTAYNFSPYTLPYPQSGTPPVTPGRGAFVLGSGASLSTAGLSVDNSEFAPAPDTTPLAIAGGSVSIASYSADLSAGSVINVSGGVEVTPKGAPDYGNGGSIKIAAAKDPVISSITGGSLTLGAELEGYSGAKGGSLSLQAQLVQVGGTPAHAGTLEVTPDFFDQGGFSSFTLTGLGEATSQYYDPIPGLVIAAGTIIDPQAVSLLEMPGAVPGGINLVPTVLPDGQRPPVSLSFNAPGIRNNLANAAIPVVARGDLIMGAGSVITTDPSATAVGSVSFNGNTVLLLGSVFAPGGNIGIVGASTSLGLFVSNSVLPTVEIGPHSVLSTAGTTVMTPNVTGYQTGVVLNGGNISVSGNIVAEAGSVLDVSGASSTLDVTPVQANINANLGNSPQAFLNGSFFGRLLVPTEIDSNGGIISLNGAQELFSDAALIGAPGGPSAIGGIIYLSSNPGTQAGASPLVPTLQVTQSGSVIPAQTYPAGQSAIGNPLLNAQSQVITPMGYIAVDSFSGGGFNSIDLQGTVQFSGPVSIKVPGAIIVSTGGVIDADAAVNLTASYVELGLPFQAPIQPGIARQDPFGTNGDFNPTFGTGDLTVNASLIDIGNLSLQGIGKASFIADNGDIRGDGTLDVAGQLLMKAGQVYVPTEVTFEIDDINAGIVKVASSSANSPTVTLALPPPAGFGVGSTLLGSTVQAINGNTVTLASDAAATVNSSTSETWNSPTSITFQGSGSRSLPLSAGGVLDVYATSITQNGTLRAPFGTINLGWDGSGSAPADPITGDQVDVTENLTLGNGSVTSVSGVDPSTDEGLIVPYGSVPDGISWIDPSGFDITAGGVPEKSISISAVNVNDQKGSVIDIKGGGDLLAYQFSPGIGGMNDILDTTSGFAVIPGYGASYAPYATVDGYANAKLAPGDQVYLNASPGLAAGVYTLLPARYALLPGAFLVTQQSGAPAGTTQALPDGGSLVSGYTTQSGQTAASLTTSFEVDPGSVVHQMATYDIFTANSFLAAGAIKNNVAVPRLPKDSGEVSFQALSALAIAGNVDSTPLSGGLGGLVDISSSPDVDIIITSAAGTSPVPNTLVLNAPELNSFAGASLVIGGVRDGSDLTVLNSNITVESGVQLAGQDIILAANDNLTVDQGAEIEASGGGQADGITVDGNGVLLRVSGDEGATVTREGVTAASSPELTIASGVKLKGESVTLDSSAGTDLDPSAIIDARAVSLNSGNISIELTNPGSNAPAPTATSGLILAGPVLQGLFANAQSLSLLSYTSIDLYGTGNLGTTAADGEAVLKNLSLNAGEINGGSGGGDVGLTAQNIEIGNTADATGLVPQASSAEAGTLTLTADKISLGNYGMIINGFANVNMAASEGVLATGKAAAPPGSAASAATVAPSLDVIGDLTITTPVITGAGGALETVTASVYSGGPAGESGELTIAAPATPSKTVLAGGGLGAKLTLIGAAGLTDNSAITANSGSIVLEALSGDLDIGNFGNATLDVSGESQTFFDVTKYTDAGQISLIAENGAVSVGSDTGATTTIDAAAQAGGGNGGTLTISAPKGTVTIAGSLEGSGGDGGEQGSFSLSEGSIAPDPGDGNLPSLMSLDSLLSSGGFTQSVSIEVQNGDVVVDGIARAANYSVTDNDPNGTITVTGEINASDIAALDPNGNPISIGGAITLQSAGSVTIGDGATLTVSADTFTAKDATGDEITYNASFNNAQRGGSVDIEAGSDVNGAASSTGYVTIANGSSIDLTVNATPVQGDEGGSLLLRAPQIGSQADPTGVQVNPIDGSITGNAGLTNITIEGYTIFDASTVGGVIENEEGNVQVNGENFVNNTGAATVASNTVTGSGIEGGLLDGDSTLPGGNVALADNIANGNFKMIIEPGAEIINGDVTVNGGDLTLSTPWDLSQDHFTPNTTNAGENGTVAGALTLRAAGNVVFNYDPSDGGASLSDGFDVAVSPDADGQLWDAPLIPMVGAPSWSYRIAAGANFGSANYAALTPLDQLSAGSGSLLLGEGAPALPEFPAPEGNNSQPSRRDILPYYFQTIRTGAGSIGIYAADDVQLLNNLATIYSAGTGSAIPTGYSFKKPSVTVPNSDDELGPTQGPFLPAQYTEYGGDVTVVAQDNIAHYQANGVTPDSTLEMPDNWLYRQGSSTTLVSWWSDFSNFYEGVGAFGGGNVSLVAGNDIINVDAVVPTNARTFTSTTPGGQQLFQQLGGGNLLVSAGDNISGGAYYVESGQGILTAGNQILTNVARSTLDQGTLSYDQVTDVTPDYTTWLPTTLFAGDASFTISAGGNILLGSVANPFLLPQGENNNYQNLSFFSTFAVTDQVNIKSLAGDIDIRGIVDVANEGDLESWLLGKDAQVEDGASFAALSEPWLSVAEADVDSFADMTGLLPGIVHATAFSGSIDLDGLVLLNPAPQGTLDLLAEGSINGLQINGYGVGNSDPNLNLYLWGTAEIDVSDANPASIPGIANPFSTNDQIESLPLIFDEIASTAGPAGVLETEEALHTSGLLHKNDPTPLHLYAETGDISGLTLYAPKVTDVVAGQDITDASFYIQNDNANDVSIISAGRDLIPYDTNSPLRLQAQSIADGNGLSGANPFIGGEIYSQVASADSSGPASGRADAGDIQINGPGTIEVLAGRNLTLGVGSQNLDGTAVGITSIGNARDPYLPATGAQIIAAAGLGGAAVGLGDSTLNWQGFDSTVLGSAAGDTYFTDLAATEDFNVPDDAAFKKLSKQQQAIVGLDLFYLVLRDAGRDHNLVGNSGYGNYAAAITAIGALLPKTASGDMNVTSKEITTVSGGDIDLIDPSGILTVGIDLSGVPPVEQGIFTDAGGNISIYTKGSVNLGSSRIFTLQGGNIIMWSNEGNIDAGNSSKTVQSAPPTRVVVDPQSGNVETDLAGLATGGGIGVLATVEGVPPGDVDLIAPTGVIDAGNAGIRATGNVSLAAVRVLNASNIQAGGSTSGVPTVTVAAPNLGALGAASSAAGAGANAASTTANNQNQQQAAQETGDSIISVSVIGYGGGDDEGG